MCAGVGRWWAGTYTVCGYAAAAAAEERYVVVGALATPHAAEAALAVLVRVERFGIVEEVELEVVMFRFRRHSVSLWAS